MMTVYFVFYTDHEGHAGLVATFSTMELASEFCSYMNEVEIGGEHYWWGENSVIDKRFWKKEDISNAEN